MKRWVEHFNSVFNQQPPVKRADISPAAVSTVADQERGDCKSHQAPQEQQVSWTRQHPSRNP